LGLVLVLNDLTPALHLDAHIEQLDRLAKVGTLAASMAHEIKNALVAGKTFVDLLLEKNREAELVDIVRRELNRIDSIVKGILRFAGPARASHSKVRVHEVLDHSLRLVQHQLDSRLIALERSFLAAPDLVSGDHGELQQAFVNLFLNAAEAMGTNGTLTVATETVPDPGAPSPTSHPGRPLHLRVTVHDTGTGIPTEHKDHLFEPFFTTKPTGTGLGLAITRRIIEEHRGDIGVDSQEGQGTTFSILLPALGEASHGPRPEVA
jgi:signal transduction histidine kinase